MKHHENTREDPQLRSPLQHPDRRRARSDWQRQQYRVDEPGLMRDDEPGPDEPDDGGS